MREVDIAVPVAVSHPAEKQLPGGFDVWVFVLGDMLIFSCYFAAYLFCDRAQNQQLFLDSQKHLSQTLGTINTLILLTSSFMVALCVQAARKGDLAIATRFLDLGGACGVGFLLVKSYEWYAKMTSGLTISSNAFFMHYYVMTCVHVVHVITGLVFLAVLRRELRQTQPNTELLEAGGIYWHMVDFIWFLMFALLYLMR